MGHIIIEIKARCNDPEKIRSILKNKNAREVGKDHQIDTYFNCPNGRLKLREGNIETNLIFYNRPNQEGPKQSDVELYKPNESPKLRALLNKAFGVKVVVDKQREIYFIENIKFQIDQVNNLGSFVEIEAIDMKGNIGREKLLEQCQGLIHLFNIKPTDLIDCSYSDLILAQFET